MQLAWPGHALSNFPSQVLREIPELQVPPVLMENQAFGDLQDPRAIKETKETKETLDVQDPLVCQDSREPKV